MALGVVGLRCWVRFNMKCVGVCEARLKCVSVRCWLMRWDICRRWVHPPLLHFPPSLPLSVCSWFWSVPRLHQRCHCMCLDQVFGSGVCCSFSVSFKERVHQKMTILSSFTHLMLFQIYITLFLSSVEHKIYFFLYTENRVNGVYSCVGPSWRCGLMSILLKVKYQRSVSTLSYGSYFE